MNRSGTEYACAGGWGIFDGPVGPSSIAAMINWRINTVRVPLNEDCWLGINVPRRYSGNIYRRAINAYVRQLSAHGLYVILDLHWGAPGDHPALGQEPMPDADHSAAFWTSVARTFRLDRNVLFELFNEPHGVSWDCWQSGCVMPGGWRAAGMQTLINAVRATGARQPVIVEGLDWGNDLTGWLSHTLRDPLHQLIAGFHVYTWNACANVKCWTTELLPLAKQVPLVATEVGENDCHGRFVGRFLGWATDHRVSALTWTWNTNQGCLSLIQNYDSGMATAYGSVVRADFRAVFRAPA